MNSLLFESVPKEKVDQQAVTKNHHERGQPPGNCQQSEKLFSFFLLLRLGHQAASVAEIFFLTIFSLKKSSLSISSNRILM